MLFMLQRLNLISVPCGEVSNHSIWFTHIHHFRKKNNHLPLYQIRHRATRFASLYTLTKHWHVSYTSLTQDKFALTQLSLQLSRKTVWFFLSLASLFHSQTEMMGFSQIQAHMTTNMYSCLETRLGKLTH